MRKRILALLAALIFLDLSAYQGQIRAQRLFFNSTVSVTSTNSAISFTDNGSGGSSVAFLARHVGLYSLRTSADTCYFDLKDTTATTADISIDPGGTWQMDFIEVAGSSTSGWPGLGAICGTAPTPRSPATGAREGG